MARWLPLESNPDVINAYIKVLGVPEKWKTCDVFGFDPELLCMVPKPVAAFFLLFPITEKYTERTQSEIESLKKEKHSVPENVFFMEQKIGNACGTIAIIHALANNKERIDLDLNGVLSKFLDKSKGVTPEEISKVLEEDPDMMEAHEKTAQEGQTEAPSRDKRVDLHFICFIQKDGFLYELDGRKPFPVPRGKSSEETFLEDAAKACQDFIAKEPGNLNFTAMALTGGDV